MTHHVRTPMVLECVTVYSVCKLTYPGATLLFFLLCETFRSTAPYRSHQPPPGGPTPSQPSFSPGTDPYRPAPASFAPPPPQVGNYGAIPYHALPANQQVPVSRGADMFCQV